MEQKMISVVVLAALGAIMAYATWSSITTSTEGDYAPPTVIQEIQTTP